MLNWVRSFFSNPLGTLDSTVKAVVQAVVSGLAGVIDTIFGNVTGAWGDLERAVEAGALAADHWALAVYRHLAQIITHDIPVFAHTAWWWTTHPGQLARVMFWDLIRLLEDNAWTVAHYLGTFAVSLILRNPRRIAAAAESVLAAIL